MQEQEVNTERCSDVELLDACFAGDAAATEDLAVRTSKLVYCIAMQRAPSVGLRMTREDLKDFNQDILLSLFGDDCRRLRAFGRRSSYAHWVSVIVTNALIDRKRSRKQQDVEKTDSIHRPLSSDPDAATLEDLIPDLAADPREQVMYRALVDAVRKARDQVLSEEEKLILDLWCSREHTEKEIGALMGRNPNTVATIISRAQVKILTFLKNKEGETV